MKYHRLFLWILDSAIGAAALVYLISTSHKLYEITRKKCIGSIPILYQHHIGSVLALCWHCINIVSVYKDI